MELPASGRRRLLLQVGFNASPRSPPRRAVEYTYERTPHTMQLTISEVGRKVGLRPSAIRYYEQIGIVGPAMRVGGQRRYDDAAVYRLTVIQRGRALGFTLEEIRTLIFAFPDATPAAPRWRHLAQKKLDELTRLVDTINARQELLREQGNCGCASLDECGKCLVESEASVTGSP
jgi:MerR family transcriptional regulator, redox-sensitive transcriptional activator SoxR